MFPIEFEFQRSLPIAMFNLWHRGYLVACRRLGLDESSAAKAFAVNDRGVFRVYTQTGNIEKMKAAASGLDASACSGVIDSFMNDFAALGMQGESLKDPAYAARLAGEFVLICVISELAAHPLREAAIRARAGAENLFYLASDVLARESGVGEGYPLYSYDELVAGRRLPPEELAAREHALLTAEAVLPVTDEAAAFAAYLQEHGLMLYERPPQPTLTELHGQVAFPGLAVGTVKVVLRPEETDKLEVGDILVSSMTSPDFLPLIKIAAAIVTDEGGVTSHAAILARELGRPCLVGTRLATKTFRDGDRVEVDATNGLVRLI